MTSEGVPLGRRAANAGILLALLGLFAPAEAGAQQIDSFAIDPAAPTTGDPVTLTAQVTVPEDCGWAIDASIGYGLQGELGPAEGWAMEILLTSTVPTCLPGAVSLPVQESLGTLPVAGGAGILRLRVRGVVEDTRLFNLTVAAGPVPGWEQPALHGGVFLLMHSAGLASVPGGLAMSDQDRQRIIVVDPRDGSLIRAFPAPGNRNARGLAFDGTNLFVSARDLTGPRIFKIDLAGRVLDSFPSPTVSPANAALEGLAFRGGVLYGSHESPPILYAMNPVNHQKIWERSLPTRIPGLDTVPAGLIGVEPTGTIYLIEPSPTGVDQVLGDIADNGIEAGASLVGLAFDGFGIFAWNETAIEIESIRTYGIWWALDGTLRVYVPDGGSSLDVVRGDVSGLRQLSGNVDLGPTTCVVADGAGGSVPTVEDPTLGEAFFYIARFRGASGFDLSYGRSSLGFRRVDFDNSCP
jgi:hypothetical protein